MRFSMTGRRAPADVVAKEFVLIPVVAVAVAAAFKPAWIAAFANVAVTGGARTA